MSRYNHLHKVALIGLPNSGKSAYLLRLTEETFKPKYDQTIGVELGSKDFKVKSNHIAKLQIWDTSGKERFLSITTPYVRGSAVAVVFIDLTEAKSAFTETLLSLKKAYGDAIKSEFEKGTKCFVVFTKKDLAEEQGITYTAKLLEETTLLAMDAIGVPKEKQDKKHYHITSAKTGENIDAAALQWAKASSIAKGLLKEEEEDAIATLTLREPTEQKSESSFLAGLLGDSKSKEPKSETTTLEIPSRYDF